MAKTPVRFTLNDAETALFVDEGANLIDVLRRGAGDLSPKQGCAQGTCGACTVLIDGQPHLACLTLAETVEGRRIDTTGGLAGGPQLHPLQTAFMEEFAAQCGFCTSGMLMAAKALLDRQPSPSRDEVAEAISGNLCRCTGYEPIIDAVMRASQRMRGAA
ncbi:MAG: (2Fe-2S)-binding protein [Aurantimonas coralicida]|jgi:aerobic carbon-monoxide dehydrogenase small subunit|uniref:(2Fe-2S)-binding protein n=1 Tax=Aurantimonas TaxID=182269 RepID=UPI0003FBDBD8|nr:(2Fe-2S)-binding protein [Aurantimonas coralicida]MCC4299667.1 (2Fe-2S)-binding protein [Aurantimonas coralicida]MCD1644114.1 (2Fe-2S)-binding protein [Aurantimonas coralicida]MCW7545634.1 (2Fe-2S)-binding protein [Aurantimonas litoralis]MDE0922724.1 (2Fe-2S)-binding protein [Aurantimonas coralicida]